MQTSRPFISRIPTLCVPLLMASLTVGRASAEEPAHTSPWTFSLSGGMIDFEGDEPVKDDSLYILQIGRALDARWGVEGAFALVPTLDESFRTDWRDGARVSRLEEAAGAGVNDTWSMRATVELLHFLAPHARLAPFLAAGGGLAWYDDGFDDDVEALIQGGGGVRLHVNDNWALRADARAVVAGLDSEVNGLYTVGLQWTPGGRVASAAMPVEASTRVKPVAPITPEIVAAPTTPPAAPGIVAAPTTPPAAPVDTDRDGLTDDEERGTYGTDPLRADTDWDVLSDGDEVHKHATDPLKRDSDGGGVYDGHEVLEDRTDPKVAEDDLLFYELRLGFDAGDWKIKAEYFSEVGVLGKALTDNPGSTARIEGHVDTYTVPGRKAADGLAKRRAEAVRDALVKDWGIDPDRLTPAGYGASRPKGPSEPPKGNAENERIEVFIKIPTK